MASLVKTPSKEPVKREPIARLIYFIERHSCRNLPVTTVRYLGPLQLYCHVFATNRNYGWNRFLFYIYGFGMATSRLFSGRLVDRGKITSYRSPDFIWFVSAFPGWVPVGWLIDFSLVDYLFLLFIALLLGIGFGTIFRIQYIIGQSGSQQPTRYSLPALPFTSWGCRYRIGYAGMDIMYK